MMRQYSVEVRLCLPDEYVAADSEIKEALLAKGRELYDLAQKHHSPKDGEPKEAAGAAYTDDFFEGFQGAGDIETAPAA